MATALDRAGRRVTARVYIRPCCFGAGRAIAGGLARFAAFELIVRESGGTRRSCHDWRDAGDVIATLDGALQAQASAQAAAVVAARRPVAGMAFAVPQVMGILNMTPDSFSDGGLHAGAEAAGLAAEAMIAAGAAIVDIGGESTRPGAAIIPLAEELQRVGPALYRLEGRCISIDTRSAAVMARALDGGAVLVNDVSALTHDPAALGLVAARECPVVIVHAQGSPQTMQAAPHYDDVLLDVFDWLQARIDVLVAAGVARDRIIVDPGIGFGKTLEHNLALLRGIALFQALGCPVLLGVSRKAMIGRLSGAAVDDRLAGSLALAVHALGQGVQMLRVHDVAATVQAVKLWAALQNDAVPSVT